MLMHEITCVIPIIENNVINASLQSEKIGSLRLLISSLPGSALRTHVESFVKPCDVNKRSQIPAW